MLEVRNTVTEMKNGFWFICRLGWAKETVNEFVDLSREISPTEQQKETRIKNTRTECLRTVGQIKYGYWEYQKEKKEEKKKY